MPNLLQPCLTPGPLQESLPISSGPIQPLLPKSATYSKPYTSGYTHAHTHTQRASVKRRLGLPESIKPSAQAHETFEGIHRTKSIGSLCACSPPLWIPPNHWHQPEKGLPTTPSQTHCYYRLQLRTARRKSSNPEALGISKPRVEIQNKCSFMWRLPPHPQPPPTPFFLFPVLVYHAIPCKTHYSTPAEPYPSEGLRLPRGSGGLGGGVLECGLPASF